MQHRKVKRPALVQAMERAAEMDHLGGLIDFEATKFNRQVQRLSRRFGLAPRVAAVIATLAYSVEAKR